MSKQKIIILVAILVFVALFFYFYKKQSVLPEKINPSIQTAEQNVLNQLSNFKPRVEDTRTPEEIKKDLNSVQAPTGSEAISNTDILNSLNSINP